LALIDQLDRVVAAGARHLPATVTATLATIARQLRNRRAFSGLVHLVGIAGGTGTGKSSLFNALAGAEYSTVGAFRPTTAAAVAWVPEEEAGKLEAFWPDLGIDEVVTHNEDHRLALVDLPDIDSIVTAHRVSVRASIPLLDTVLWVVDPEKYRDRVLHQQFLRPLAAIQHRLRFVLNQIDRLAIAELEIVAADLTTVLSEGGYRGPVIWMTSADPPSGPPIGIEAVREGLAERAFDRSTPDDRTREEIERALGIVAPYVAPIGLAGSWSDVKVEAAGLLGGGRTGEGWRVLRETIQSLAATAPEIDASVDLPGLVGPVTGSVDAIARRLDATIGRHLRDAVRPRAVTGALVTELGLALARVRG
jgi:hypothetical protein